MRNSKTEHGSVYQSMVDELQKLKIENVFLRSAARKAPPEDIERLLDTISDLRRNYPLSPILIAAGIPRSTYYYYLKRKERPDKYEEVREEIRKIYGEHSGLYGYRRITIELRKRGYNLNHKTVYRLMRDMDIRGQKHSRPYTAFRGDIGEPIPNLLGKDLSSDVPMMRFATDITEIRGRGHIIYLSVLMDLFNGEIVAYHISHTPGIGLVMATIEKLPAQDASADPSRRMTIHSDRGWQYQSERYRNYLKERGILQSMTKKERCYGNAPVESFFSILKSELPLYAAGQGRSAELYGSVGIATMIHKYIFYYNNKRIKTGLGGVSPVEYRQIYSIPTDDNRRNI